MKRLQRAADRLRVEPDLLVKAAVWHFQTIDNRQQKEMVIQFLKRGRDKIQSVEL